jgi:hypothetical protein
LIQSRSGVAYLLVDEVEKAPALSEAFLFGDCVTNVRFGSSAAIAGCPLHVGFTTNNGHSFDG